MNAIRTAFLAAAFSFGAALPAPAMTVADLSHARAVFAAPVDFAFADEIAPGRSARAGLADQGAAAAAAEDYFNYDTLITLGALAIAGGALAAFGAGAMRRGRTVEEVEPAWRESVFRAVQAELTQYSESFRRAA